MLMSKVIDLNKPVRDLIDEYPEVARIMKDLGFESITNPAMLNTAGRFMTLKKGSVMKKIDLDKIKKHFEAEGFEIKD
jgi:hypothetical protein